MKSPKTPNFKPSQYMYIYWLWAFLSAMAAVIFSACSQSKSVVLITWPRSVTQDNCTHTHTGGGGGWGLGRRDRPVDYWQRFLGSTIDYWKVP